MLSKDLLAKIIKQRMSRSIRDRHSKNKEQNLKFKFLKTSNRFQQNSIQPLREKCPYSEWLWSVFFRIRTEYERYLVFLSVFSPNAGKYGPE